MDIANNFKVLKACCGFENIVLSSDNRKIFKQLFGKQNGTFKGEFFYYFWNIDYKGYAIRIYTAKTKGTVYDLMNYNGTVDDYQDDDFVADIMIEFLEELKNKINEQNI